MAIGAGVENDRLAGAAGLLNPGDEIAFVIRLAEDHAHAAFAGRRDETRLDIGKRLAAIDLRLARAEQIEIGSVEDVNGLHHPVFG